MRPLAIGSFLLLVACGGDGGGGGDDDGVGADAAPVSDEPQTLDGAASGNVGDYVSIAVGQGGDVHISYVDNESGDLKYVRSTGGTFGTPVAVDPDSGDIVQDTAIAVDGSGEVHIVYHDAIDVDLKYVHGPGGTFGTPAIVDGADHQSGTGLRLSMDGSGNLHVLYFDYMDVSFKYARTSGGVFDGGTPVPEIIGGTLPAIVVDSAGNLHVSAHDGLSALTYMKRTGTTFSTPVELDTGGVGMGSAIDVDGDDKVHIAFTDETNGVLKYVSGSGTTFGAAVVADSEGVGGINPAIAVDASGNAHMVHYDIGGMRVRYARASASGTISGQKAIDPLVDGGATAAVAVDSDGNAHIAYSASLGVGRSALKYVAVPAN